MNNTKSILLGAAFSGVVALGSAQASPHHESREFSFQKNAQDIRTECRTAMLRSESALQTLNDLAACELNLDEMGRYVNYLIGSNPQLTSDVVNLRPLNPACDQVGRLKWTFTMLKSTTEYDSQKSLHSWEVELLRSIVALDMSCTEFLHQSIRENLDAETDAALQSYQENQALLLEMTSQL